MFLSRSVKIFLWVNDSPSHRNIFVFNTQRLELLEGREKSNGTILKMSVEIKLIIKKKGQGKRRTSGDSNMKEFNSSRPSTLVK